MNKPRMHRFMTNNLAPIIAICLMLFGSSLADWATSKLETPQDTIIIQRAKAP